MDTINNLTNAATKAIWGEGQHEEPVSGKMGNVSAGEPYDAGNIGEDNDAALKANKNKTDNQDVAHIPSEPAPTSKTTGVTVPEPMPKPEPEAATKPRFVEENNDTTKPTTTTTNATNQAKLDPSAASMRTDSTQAQNDNTRPPPSTDTQSKPDTTTSTIPSAIPGTKTAETTTAAGIPGTGTPANTTANKDEAKNDQATPSIDDHHAEVTDKKNMLKDDSVQDVKLVGPGPRPLEEIARKHGGDAGAVSSAPAPAPAAAAGAGGGAAAAGGGGQRRRDSGKSVGGEGEEEGAGKGAHPAGTEEHVVKSSGLAADGGDFDAARPGAGREADRLLDAKGVHHGNPHGHHGASTSTGTSTSTEASTDNGHGTENGGKEKVGLKDKIKAKLHKNSTSA